MSKENENGNFAKPILAAGLIKKWEGKITELNKIMANTHPSTANYNYFRALIFQLKECIQNLKDAS